MFSGFLHEIIALHGDFVPKSPGVVLSAADSNKSIASGNRTTTNNSRPYIVGSTNCTLNTHLAGNQRTMATGRRGHRPLQKHTFFVLSGDVIATVAVSGLRTFRAELGIEPYEGAWLKSIGGKAFPQK